MIAVTGCAARPPDPLEAPAPRHPDYFEARSSASSAETAYTRQLKQRLEAPPRETAQNVGPASAGSRRQPTPLPSVSETIAELYSAGPQRP